MRCAASSISRLLAQRDGSVAVMVAVLMTLFVFIIGAVVDTSRLHSVRGQAQAAADAALLGGVSTLSTVSLQEEATRLFNANFIGGRWGATASSIQVTEVSAGVYQMQVTVSVPTIFMHYLSNDLVTFTLTSEVTRGYEVVSDRGAEIALVLDNTGSMAGAKMDALKQASRELVDIVFGSAATLDNIYISVVPYNNVVNIGAARIDWIQMPSRPAFTGVASNRNSDNPPNGFNDITDDPPLTNNLRFRIPDPAASMGDFPPPGAMAQLAFARQDKASLYNTIDSMDVAGLTRINVGLMWGWMTLSPKWQGLWDAGRPNLPLPVDVTRDKIVILMTDGLNTVYKGDPPGSNHDDTTTTQLCDALKTVGIRVYTIGFSDSVSGINETLLRNCATEPGNYYFAPSGDELREAFKEIGDQIVYTTLRVSH